MLYIIGILIALGSLVASVIHLDQSASSYYDFVGLVMVVGGTLAVAVITLPWEMRSQIFKHVFELFYRPSANKKELIESCLKTHKNITSQVFDSNIAGPGLAFQILRDGVELVQLGFSADKIEAILRERVYHSVERIKYIANSIRGLSKYPPAFGLAGTVLGLVHLMRGVSDGMSPQETGIRMAIALIATFYGLLVANLIINPMGEAIYKNAHEEEKLGEIALQAIMLAADKSNLLETQEMLNSFVEINNRVSWMNNDFENETSAVENEPAA
jgi:chemotaxis protein MotA